MTPAEIIEGLRGVSTSLLDEEFTVSESQALDAAIAHLQPHTQPITPEGLEVRGFELTDFMGEILYARWVSGGCQIVQDRGKGGYSYRIETIHAEDITLPGCRTLGDVDDLVRMLEGGDGA